MGVVREVVGVGVSVVMRVAVGVVMRVAVKVAVGVVMRVAVKVAVGVAAVTTVAPITTHHQPHDHSNHLTRSPTFKHPPSPHPHLISSPRSSPLPAPV